MQKLCQKDSESIDDFASRLKLQAYKCELRDEEDVNTRVIKQLIAGAKHAELQK